MTSDPVRIVPARLKDKNQKAVASFSTESIVRLDIFKNSGGNGKVSYHYIPVYIHQLSDALPPSKTFVLRKPWTELPTGSDFLYSFWPWDLIEVKYKGEVQFGYYRGFHRDDGRIYMSLQFQSEAKKQLEFSPSLINRMNKWSIDRLGQRHLVESEQRTWRGKVCISPNLQG